MLSRFIIPLNCGSLILYTAVLAAGITAGALGFNLSLQAFCVWLIFVGVTAFAAKTPTKLLFCFGFFLTGAFAYKLQTENHQQLSKLMNNNHFAIIGTITSIESQQSQRAKQCITIETTNVRINNYASVWLPLAKTVQIYTNKYAHFAVGDLVQINDIFIKATKNNDYEQYLCKENIDASLFLSSIDYAVMQRPSYSFQRTLAQTKKRILNTSKKSLSPETFALFSSIFLGNKNAAKKEMQTTKDLYKIWGISHYLARSGLHMVIVVIIWDMILNLAPLSFLLKQILMLMLGFMYCLCSWSSISFLRAFVMFFLYKICVISKLPINTLQLLSIVTFLVLLFNPMQLFFLDFQLSFGLTYALAWFTHIYTTKHREY